MNLKKGFAETPDTGFGEKQGGKTTKNPLLNYLLSLSFISHARAFSAPFSVFCFTPQKRGREN
jgi:hypothetical protein